MSYKKSGVHLHGSPLHKFLGMDGKQWANIGVGVASGIASIYGGPAAGAAVSSIGGSLVENNMEGADEKAARQRADYAADMAKINKKNEEAAAQGANLKAGGYGGNTTATGGSGMGAVSADPVDLSSLDPTLDPVLMNQVSGIAGQVSSAMKKMGTVDYSYTNLKMPLSQAKAGAAMMTVSGASTLMKKGCYKPK